MSDLTPEVKVEPEAVDTDVLRREADKQMVRHMKKSRPERDVRGLLATISIIGAFTLGGFNLYVNDTADIPAWVAGLVAVIVTVYFKDKNGSAGQG